MTNFFRGRVSKMMPAANSGKRVGTIEEGGGAGAGNGGRKGAEGRSSSRIRYNVKSMF